ncbi:MAG: 3-hydroxyisobutyrate dehydrogenase [Micavibrio sp.]|nr:3-hydroxyisobutyrate dehydrogenase [Micavibrio sp.]
MQHIAFIGLGNMGGPMARNLLAAKYTVTAFDVAETPLAAAVTAGATAALSIAQAVAAADIVITMLPASSHVEAAYLNAGGILGSAKNGALLVDCSTIDADVARKVATAASNAGFAMIDAPVSGGTAGAAAATLTFIVGGPEAALEKARPVLSSMGKNIFHAGGSGAGQVAKMCNNMLLAIQMIGTAEALNLGTRCGLDATVLSNIMVKSSGRNWALEVYNPCPGVMENAPAARDYSGGFGTDLMLKDLGVAATAAHGSGSATPLGNHALELYRQHSAEGHGKLDFSSIIQLLARSSTQE